MGSSRPPASKARSQVRTQPKTKGIDRNNRAGNLKVAEINGVPKRVAYTPRSTRYSEELIDRIFAEMVEGKLLEEICEDPSMPSPLTVYNWLQDPSKPHLAEKYRFARVAQCDAMARLAQRTAQTPLLEIRTRSLYDAKGKLLSKQISEQDNVARSALIVGTQQWLLAKMFPKKYGEKLQLTAEVDDTLLKELSNSLGLSPIEEQPSYDNGNVVDISSSNPKEAVNGSGKPLNGIPKPE